MTTDQSPAPATVVVHCGDLTGGRLERRLRDVTASLPAEARVVATVLAGSRLSPRTASRVHLAVVRDGGAALLAAEVAGPDALVVLPVSARVAGPWFTEVVGRLEAQPEMVGVLPLGGQHLFAFPAGVTDLDAARTEWAAVTGLTAAVSSSAKRSLSAVLIVKDEEVDLPSCLGALTPVVDEVVVYDTGSSDATVALARQLGAVVVEGTWEGDFSAARNRALAHATGDWVLSVDADEVLATDRAELRRWLDGTRGDAALVSIVSASSSSASTGDEIRAVRLFRRADASWTGALHEQVVPRPGTRAWVPCPTPPPLQLMHSGYVLGHERAAEKAERNLTIAAAAVAALPEGTPEWVEATVALARALGQARREEDCIAALRLVADSDMTAGNVVQAARGLVPLLLQRGLLDEASHWTTRAEAAGEAPGLTALRRALVRFARGEHLDAVADLERLVAAGPAGCGRDLWGKPFDETVPAATLADLQVVTGRGHAAATRMVQMMAASPDRVPLRTLLESVVAAGGDLAELASYAPEALVARSLHEAPVAVPDLALAWVSALAEVRPTDVRVLVAGSVLAARTSVEVALEWSVRVREAGLGDLCPLRVVGLNTDLHPRSRLFALGLLHHGLGDTELDEALRTLSAAVDPADGEQVLAQLRRYAPAATLVESSVA